MSLVLRGRTAFAVLSTLFLAGGVVLSAALQPAVALASGSSPYAASSILGSVKWNEKSKHRLGAHEGAAGSDIWSSTWASSGNLVSGWGDGEGLTGTSEAQIGVTKLEGTPTESTNITGADLYFGAAKARVCEEKPTKVDGKPHGLIGLPGEVIYMFHSSENLETCEGKEKTVHPSFLAKSTDNGKTWTDRVGSLKWPDEFGFSPASVLAYGKAQAGALTAESGTTGYIYIYGRNKNDAKGSGKVYLARVPASPVTEIESISHWQFYDGLEKGVPVWGKTAEKAVAVITDSNGGSTPAVSFDKGIGRYIAVDNHFDVCGEKKEQCEPERAVSLFDAATPWGPWTTFDYENQFDNSECTECLGDGENVSFELPTKWMSASGLTVWSTYSSLNKYDSLNLIEGTISLATNSTVDNIAVQPVGTATAGTPAVTSTMSLTSPDDKLFIDRPYQFTTIPVAYRGLEQIRLANSDKSATAANYLTFTLTKKENVCVGWDSRHTLPTWLSGWTKQAAENNVVGEDTGGGSVTFNVYKKEFAAGTVELHGAETTNDQYVVFVGC